MVAAKWEASAAQHSTAQHSTAQHSTAQHSTAQHSTAGISQPSEHLSAHYVGGSPDLSGLAVLQSGHLLAFAISARQMTSTVDHLDKVKQRLGKEVTCLDAAFGAHIRWACARPEYQQAAEELKQPKHSQAHAAMQDEVSDLGAIWKIETTSGMASHVTRRLCKRAKRHQKASREPLHLLETWARILQIEHATAVTYEATPIFQGNPLFMLVCSASPCLCKPGIAALP